MSGDPITIRVYNGFYHKEFETGMKSMEAAVSDMNSYLEKMSPDMEIVIRKRNGGEGQ